MPFSNKHLKEIIKNQEKCLDNVFRGNTENKDGLCESISRLKGVHYRGSNIRKEEMFDFLYEHNLVARKSIWWVPERNAPHYHDHWNYYDGYMIDRINFHLFRIYCVEYYRVFLYGEE